MNRIKYYKKVFDDIVTETMNYLYGAGIYNMVLGISGGIDSTLVAAIAYRICQLDPQFKLYGLCLMTDTNKDDEVELAYRVANAFTYQFISEDITNECNQLFKKFKDDVNCLGIDDLSNVAKGNIKARYRMNRIYNVAGSIKGIVLDTDNLTEHYLGFYTLHGDQGDYNPIGNLWKHEIFDMIGHMTTWEDIYNEEQIQVFLDVFNMIPTDGNGVLEGGDMEQIAPGCTFNYVDSIIWDILEEVSFAEIIHKYENDVSAENIKRIFNRYANNIFKQTYTNIPKPELDI